MIPIKSLKELAKKLSFYQSSISEEERISLILFSVKEFLTWQGIKVEDETVPVKSAPEYFETVNKATIDDLSWLKHGETDLGGYDHMDYPNETVKRTLLTLCNAYRNYYQEIKSCGDTTHQDFTGLDKYMNLIKAIFYYVTGQQPYNFTKSKPTLKTIDKMLRESSSDLSSEEIQSIRDVLDDIKEVESEVS